MAESCVATRQVGGSGCEGVVAEDAAETRRVKVCFWSSSLRPRLAGPAGRLSNGMRRSSMNVGAVGRMVERSRRPVQLYGPLTKGRDTSVLPRSSKTGI